MLSMVRIIEGPVAQHGHQPPQEPVRQAPQDPSVTMAFRLEGRVEARARRIALHGTTRHVKEGVP